MGVPTKLRLLSHLFLTLSSVFLLNLLGLPTGNGHLASVLDEGEPKSPLLEHNRASRVPLLHSPERLEVSRLPYLRHPSYTHKFLSNQRLMKFHQGNPPLTPQLRDPDLSSSDASFERLLSKFASGSGNRENESGENLSDQESPTFTPYISARALSNMEKFFHHLRENLEALQKGDVEGQEETRDSETAGNGSRNGEDDDSMGSASPEKALASTGYQFSPLSPEWKPRASGVLGLKKIRSFFPSPQNPESRSRLGTNLGLGRKR